MKGTFPRSMFSCSVVLVFSGCAWTAQQVNLNPAIDVIGASVGKGRSVYVNVKDERSTQLIGYKIPTGGGEIKPVQDPALVVRDALVSGLHQLGFETANPGSGAAPELSVELRAIEYKVTQGFWSGGLTADVALKAYCKVGNTAKYDSMYRGHHEENIQAVQSQTANEGYINHALSEAINATLRDQELLRCLASSG